MRNHIISEITLEVFNISNTQLMLITVAARSKAWTVFARSKTGAMGSNPTRGMDVCVRLFCDFAVLCAGSGLATGWSPVQRVLHCVKNQETEKAAKAQQRAVEP
jgi:hypothetical protein